MDFKKLLEILFNKVDSLHIFLCAFIFFILKSHNVLSDLGVIKYDVSNIPILFDAFEKNVIDAFVLGFVEN